MGEPPGQPRLASHETAKLGWPGSVEDPRPSGCFAKRSGGGSIELLGADPDRTAAGVEQPSFYGNSISMTRNSATSAFKAVPTGA